MNVKHGLLVNIVAAILLNTTPTMSGMGQSSLIILKIDSKGDPSHIGFWGRMIDAIRKLPSNTVGQSTNDANVVLQAVRRNDHVELPSIPRIKQPQGGNAPAMPNGNQPAGASQALEVYHGPLQGSVRDPSRDFPLIGRSRYLQERNPAEHMEIIEAIRPRRPAKPGRSLSRNTEENGFLDARVPRDSSAAMKNLNPAVLRNIITDWTAFRMDHPVAAKVVKYSGWLLAASATTGGSVLLSTEIGKLLRADERNITENEIQWHITNFMAKFDDMIDESLKEFDKKPNPGIFDIYFDPLSRVKRDGKTTDFQFDFARVPPLPTPSTTTVKGSTFTLPHWSSGSNGARRWPNRSKTVGPLLLAFPLKQLYFLFAL